MMLGYIMGFGVLCFGSGIFLVAIGGLTASLAITIVGGTIMCVGGLYVPLKYIQNGED
jgi:hypothetical protein